MHTISDFQFVPWKSVSKSYMSANDDMYDAVSIWKMVDDMVNDILQSNVIPIKRKLKVR